MKIKSFIIIILFSVLVTGCINVKFGTNGIRGNGFVVTQKRQIQNFNKIDVSGIFQVNFRRADNTSLKIIAEKNLLKYISIRVENNTIVISTTKDISPQKELNVYLTSPELISIESSGVTKVIAENLLSDSFNVDQSGASKIVLSGTANKLHCNVSGVSKLDAKNFQVNKANVKVSGVSHVTIFVNKELSVNASGVSKVNYYGNPIVNADVSGVSSVNKM